MIAGGNTEIQGLAPAQGRWLASYPYTATPATKPRTRDPSQ